MRLFEARQIPYKRWVTDDTSFIRRKNYGLIMDDGLVLYGARSKRDLFKRLTQRQLDTLADHAENE